MENLEELLSKLEKQWNEAISSNNAELAKEIRLRIEQVKENYSRRNRYADLCL